MERGSKKDGDAAAGSTDGGWTVVTWHLEQQYESHILTGMTWPSEQHLKDIQTMFLGSSTFSGCWSLIGSCHPRVVYPLRLLSTFLTAAVWSQNGLCKLNNTGKFDS